MFNRKTEAQAPHGLRQKIINLARKHGRNLKGGLEQILVDHRKKCADCISFYDCEILRLSQEQEVKIKRISQKKRIETHHLANAVEFDEAQCIGCHECLDACQKQGLDCLEVHQNGLNETVSPKTEANCVYCGQCTLVCPAASAQEQSACKAVEELLKNKNNILIAQFAPALRVSLGENFGFDSGINCEERIYAALEKIGFDYIADINFGADLTTLFEATELFEMIKNKEISRPLITSCCPAWVAYAEAYQPQLKPFLAKSLSPHLYSAKVIKSLWVQDNGVNPKEVKVVSFVPCTAKKYEAAREDMKLNGSPLVDYVLTARELAYLLKKHKIDFKNLTVNSNSSKRILNFGSGAAAIYGASGGVMQSALRTLAHMIGDRQTDKLLKIEFKSSSLIEGLKIAEVDVADQKLKLGIVSGLKSLIELLPELNNFDYLEVMACPGGCLNGGGQKLCPSEEILEKRRTGLFNLDQARKIRAAHENLSAVDYFNRLKENNL